MNIWALRPAQKSQTSNLDRVFIGSCTNGRIEDLRAVADVVKGKSVADHVDAMIVPGSGLVKEQAEAEGLDKVFVDAGFEWREPGCSMCLAMNDDRLKPEERCASTSNRNFEGSSGLQGPHTSCITCNGRSRSCSWPLCRYSRLEVIHIPQCQ